MTFTHEFAFEGEVIQWHVCEVCGTTMDAHESFRDCEYCSTDEQSITHFPATCCPGCPCGSWEEQHPGVDPNSIYDCESAV